jgi:hypothetical protein
MTWLFRLLFAFVGVVFLSIFLVAWVSYTVWASLRWLITGRKPRLLAMWEQYHNLRNAFDHRGASPFPQPQSDNVVDVEARRVPDDPAASSSSPSPKSENKG